MNRATVPILALAFLMFFVSMSPALAEPVQKISFSATQATNPTQPPQGDDYSMTVTDGDTVHIRNMKGAGTTNSTLNCPRLTPKYQGTTSSTMDLNINLKTGEGELKRKETWTFAWGRFEGVIICKLTGLPFTTGMTSFNITAHGVLRGTDSFEGQMLIVDGTKVVGVPMQWTGTLVIPK